MKNLVKRLRTRRNPDSLDAADAIEMLQKQLQIAVTALEKIDTKSASVRAALKQI